MRDIMIAEFYVNDDSILAKMALYLGWPIEDVINELVRYGCDYILDDDGYGDVENKIYSAYHDVRFSR